MAMQSSLFFSAVHQLTRTCISVSHKKKQLMPRITFVVKSESNLAGRTYGVVLRRPGTPGRVGIPVGRLLVPEKIFF